MSKPQVAILMGSGNDWPDLRPAAETLKKFGVPFVVKVCSAHRTPEAAAAFASKASAEGLQVLIAAAGGAAHLAGVLAAHTTLPVIGIPVAGGALNGLDALLSTVQMPSGIPVATVAVGKAGPSNAALLAVQILALSNDGLRQKLAAQKESLKKSVTDADATIQAELAAGA